MNMTILIDNVTKIKEFNKLTLEFPCDIDVISGHYIIDAKSLMGLFSVDLSKPIEIKLDNKYEDLARLYFSKFEVKE